MQVLFRRAVRCTALIAAASSSFLGATALATPPGTLEYTSTWYGGRWSVTGQGPNKTTATFEKWAHGTWHPFATRTVPPTSGRIWSLVPNDVPYSGHDVRINWGGGNVTAPLRIARLENSDNPAIVTVSAGVPQMIGNFGVSLYQNTAESKAAFGTQWLTPGSAFTMELPGGFTWNGTPAVLPLGPGLTLGAPQASGSTLTIPIEGNDYLSAFSGFRIESTTIFYDGSGEVGIPGVAMTFQFDNPGVPDYTGNGQGYCEMQLFEIVPAPSALALLGLAAASPWPRRRR